MLLPFFVETDSQQIFLSKSFVKVFLGILSEREGKTC